MQNKAHLELEDFEAENLAKLQKMFSRKWEFVFMQAEAQYKYVAGSYEKVEKKFEKDRCTKNSHFINSRQ